MVVPKFIKTHDLGHTFAAPGSEAHKLLLGAAVIAEGNVANWLSKNGYRTQETGDRPIRLKVSVEIEEVT
jgi:hypothetical protein